MNGRDTANFQLQFSDISHDDCDAVMDYRLLRPASFQPRITKQFDVHHD